MKTRTCLAMSALLLAAPALAQEQPGAAGTDTQMKTEQPATTPAPATDQMAPAPDKMAPAENMAPAAEPSPQAKANVPAEIVITDLTAVDDSKKIVKPWGLPADEVAQMDVFNSNGKKIGEVDEVLQDKNGEIKGVAVGYGGFLGFGEKRAIVNLDQLRLKDGTIVTELDEDTLPQQPVWNK